MFWCGSEDGEEAHFSHFFGVDICGEVGWVCINEHGEENEEIDEYKNGDDNL